MAKRKRKVAKARAAPEPSFIESFFALFAPPEDKPARKSARKPAAKKARRKKRM